MKHASWLGVSVLVLLLTAATTAHSESREVVIRGGTLLTVTQGTIPNGAILIRDGKIVEVGRSVRASPGALVIDATGKFVTPGLIDAHNHIGLDGDVNEVTSPVTPHMMMEDAFHYDDKDIYYTLAGGVTASLLLHGSANMIGGQSVVIKHKFGKSREEMLFPGAPRSIKFASGENPKRVYGSRNQMPASRMGNFAVLRQALTEAQDYLHQWEEYEKKVAEGKKPTPPKKDLKLEALADLLRGKLLVHVHCYRADEFLTEMRIAREFGYKIRAFHHALEGYKVADEIIKEGIGIATHADWWGYKVEAWDAIPQNATFCRRRGARVAIISDSGDYSRRLNQEAAKTIQYGGATEDEALRMITLDAAWIIGVDDRVGSLEPGKDADITIWDRHPLNIAARAEKVLIDGEVYFDRSLPGYGLPFYQAAPASPRRGEQ